MATPSPPVIFAWVAYSAVIILSITTLIAIILFIISITVQASQQ